MSASIDGARRRSTMSGLGSPGESYLKGLSKALAGAAKGRHPVPQLHLEEISSLVRLAAHQSPETSARAMKSLERLTGFRFRSGQSWEKWWDKEGEEFVAQTRAVREAWARAMRLAFRKDWDGLYEMLGPEARSVVSKEEFASACIRNKRVVRRHLRSPQALESFKIEGTDAHLARLPWREEEPAAPQEPTRRHRPRKRSLLKALRTGSLCLSLLGALLGLAAGLWALAAAASLVFAFLVACEGFSWFRRRRRPADASAPRGTEP